MRDLLLIVGLVVRDIHQFMLDKLFNTSLINSPSEPNRLILPKGVLALDELARLINTMPMVTRLATSTLQ